jgi:hypothetical protein
MAGNAVAAPQSAGSTRLAVLLAMAMFVLVVDTSLMNVSISYVVHDLHATASGVQGTIALEALVSAAFILIGSKVGDLIGRKRAYVLGLLGYAAGALAMTLSDSLLQVIIFWAVVGGLAASLLLPAMQSLIHGNFSRSMQRKAYALVGAAAAIAAAVGPLLGGFITTYLSWRVGFGFELVIIAIVLFNIRLIRDVPYTGPRRVDPVGSVLSVIGMGGIVLGILVWQEGGGAVGALLAVGVLGLGSLVWWLRRRKREGKPVLLDPNDAVVVVHEQGRGNSKVLSPRQQEQVAHVLKHDAQVISNTQLEELLKGKAPAVQDEIIEINTDARHDALQIALIIPLLAAAIGFLESLRMMRLPDPKPSEAAEMALV